MLSVPNNTRFRFCDSDRDAQVIISQRDYDKMVKSIAKQCNISKTDAKKFINYQFYAEIVRVYGEPSKVTIILDSSSVVIH